MTASATTIPQHRVRITASTLVVISIVLLVAVVLVLWLPFDWKRIGTVEWWDIYVVNDIEGIKWIDLTWYRNRPFVWVPFNVGYALTSDSFVGANISFVVIYILRLLLLYLISRELFPKSAALPLAFTLIASFYPADSGLMGLRAITLHFALVLYFAGTLLMLYFWRTGSVWAFAMSSILTGVSVLTHPVATAVIGITPALLWWNDGRRITRRLLVTSGIWLGIQGAVLAYTMLINTLTQGGTYQDSLWVWNSGLSAYKIKSLVLAPALMFIRHFGTGWARAAAELFNHPVYLIPGSLAGVGTGAILWLERQAISWWQEPAKVRAYLGWIAIGLVVMLVGFLPYWITKYRLIDWRVYFVSALGAALIVLLVFRLIDQFANAGGRVFIVLSAAAVTLSITAALHQSAWYEDISLYEQTLVADIVEQVPALRQTVNILIVDPDFEPTIGLPARMTEHLSYPRGLVEALRFVYEDYDRVETLIFCSTEFRDSTCTFNADGVSVNAITSAQSIGPLWMQDELAYEDVLIFAYEGGDLVLLKSLPWAADGYDPASAIDADAPPPWRALTLFSDSIAVRFR